MTRAALAALGAFIGCAQRSAVDLHEGSSAVGGLSFVQEALTVGLDRAREPAAAAGVPHFAGTNNLPYGTILEDFDGDGHPDVFVVNHGQAPHLSGLWSNLGDRFAANVYTTNVYLPGFDTSNPPATGWLLTISDFTGDGRPDILMGGWNGYAELCVNSQPVRFVCRPGRFGSHVADHNGDGRPDVWVLDPATPYSAYSDAIGMLPHVWALNNGSEDMTTWPTSAALGFYDLDGDGFPDRLEGIPTSNRGTYGLATAGQRFYRGGGSGMWTETMSGLEAVTDPAAQIVDIDEDGCLDVGFDPTGYRDNPYWYVQARNLGGCLGTFSAVARTALPFYPGFARYREDLDNDGVSERVVLVHAAYGSNDGFSGGAHIFARSGGEWAEVAASGLAHVEAYYDALTFADWNGDGLLDVGDAEAISAPGTDHGIGLWTNHTATANHWLDVALPGLSGPFVGAAHIAVGGQSADVLPGAWGNQRHHFGLGAAATADVRVTFPSGIVVTRSGVAADQAIAITEAQLEPGGAAPEAPDAGADVAVDVPVDSVNSGPEIIPEAFHPESIPELQPDVALDVAPDSPAGTQLLPDPGFESGVSGFFSSDTVEQVTTGAISGAHSLHVSLGPYSSAWWSAYVEYSPVNRGSALAFSADVRGESVSAGYLQLCAVAYTAAGAYLQQCVAATAGAGVIEHVTATLPLPPGTLSYLKARLMPAAGTAIDYTVDGAALVLLP